MVTVDGKELWKEILREIMWVQLSVEKSDCEAVVAMAVWLVNVVVAKLVFGKDPSAVDLRDARLAVSKAFCLVYVLVEKLGICWVDGKDILLVAM